MKGIAMKSKQRGITLISFVLVLVVACFFGYMGMVLGPAYSEYWGVVTAMKFVANEAKPGDTDIEAMRQSLNKQFNVGYVETVSGKDAQLVKDKNGNLLSINYEARKSFVYNIDFVLKFAFSAPIGSKTAGE